MLRLPAPKLAHPVPLAWRALAKFRLGDWDGMQQDILELEGLDPLPFWFLPVTTAHALMHQLRGNDSHARALLDQADIVSGTLSQLPRAAGDSVRALALLGDAPGAWALVDATWKTPTFRSRLLEGECDVVAITGAWERAPDAIAKARAEAERAELVALPLFADRLEGRAALASGDAAGAIDPLTRARDGFKSLGARWDKAASSLSLGEALLATGARDAGLLELQAALDVFDELGSVREIARARTLLGTPT